MLLAEVALVVDRLVADEAVVGVNIASVSSPVHKADFSLI